MDAITQLVQSIVASVGPFVPRAISALILALVIWVIALIVRGGIKKAGSAANLDGRLGNQGLTSTFGDLGYWLVWLIGLPMILGALQLSGLLEPVSALVAKLLAFVPNLLSAGVILGIGFLVAGIVRNIVASLARAAGSEGLALRLGMAESLGKGGLAGLAGSIVWLLILLPVLASGLQVLGLDAVSKPLADLLTSITNLIPNLISAAVIVTIAVILGRIVANIVTGLLTGAGFNLLVGGLGFGANIAGRSPSELGGTVVLFVIVIGAVTQAAQVLGLEVFTGLIATMGVIGAQLLAGLVVLGVALWIANLAASAVRSSKAGNAALLASVTRVLILFFAVPLALAQMGLPSEIVTIGFGGIVGAAMIAAAIAFGIGGRNAAEQMLEDARKAVNHEARPVVVEISSHD